MPSEIGCPKSQKEIDGRHKTTVKKKAHHVQDRAIAFAVIRYVDRQHVVVNQPQHDGRDKNSPGSFQILNVLRLGRDIVEKGYGKNERTRGQAQDSLNVFAKELRGVQQR